MLLNKSDFLTEEMREHWNQYFKEQQVEHIFFSAKDETTKIEEEAQNIESTNTTNVDSDFMSELKQQITEEEKEQ